MKKEKLKRIARRITAFAAAVAMAATFTFPAELGDGFFDGFGNAIVASAETYTAEYDISVGSFTIDADGTYRIYGSTTTNTVIVAKDVSANITLDNVDIDVSGTSRACAFKIADDSTGNVTITLADCSENTLKSGMNCAGLQKNGNNGNLTITGSGSLKATGGYASAGIGSSRDMPCSNIVISGGEIYAKGGDSGAGIGGSWGGDCSTIKISGGTVTANGGENGAGIGGGQGRPGKNITISGGIVTAIGGENGAGIGGGLNDYNGNGDNITIEGGIVTANGGNGGAGIGGGNGGVGSNITITGGSVKVTAGSGANAIGGGLSGGGAVTPILADGTTKVFLYKITEASSIEIDGVTYPTTHNGENSLYPYLSAGYHTVKIDEVEKTIHIAEDGTITDPATPATQGAFEIYGGELDTDYSYSGGVLTIKKATPLMIKNTTPTTATTDRIEVESGISANITLAGVNIVASSNIPLRIADNSRGNVTITLADGTENELVANSIDNPGLGKISGVDSGTLTINGNGKLTATGNWNCAGIGGDNTANIVIESGTIIANGGGSGAGIGSGLRGTATNIVIKGGTITATGGERRANSTTYGNINIGGSGIGGGADGDASIIIIEGGSVLAKVTNNRAMPIGKGGAYSPYASPAEIESRAITPTNGTENVYLLEVTNTDGSAITINGETYPTNHNGEAKIYAYLPAKSLSAPNEVKVGSTTTYCYYDTTNSKWINIIDDVTINIDNPTAGDPFATSAAVVSPSTGVEAITSSDIVWKDASDNVVSGTAGYNKKYTVYVTLKASSGYAFKTDVGAAVNTAGTATVFENNGDTITVKYTFGNTVAETEINSVDIVIDEPTAGSALAANASVTETGVNTTAPAISWTGTTDTNGKAKYNTEYTASVTLAPDTGYKFASDITANIKTSASGSAVGTGTVTPNATDGTITVEYTFTTAKAKLISITNPTAITGVASGTAKTADALGLPSTVSIVTEDTSVTSASVSWDVSSASYDPSVLTGQTFTVNGTVTLPTDIVNTDNVSLNVTISVTVSAADTVADPTASPIGGTYTENQSVVLSCATSGATIYFTTDGTAPTASSTRYTSPISVTGTAGQSVTTTIKAIAVKDGMQNSSVATFTYIIEIPAVTHTITATAGAGGSISPSGSVTVADNDSQTFTITPDSGYEIDKFTVDNVDVTATTSYTFTNVTANHTISVTFKQSHTHSYGTEWKTDSTSHWHECSCGEKTDVESHTEDSGTVTTEPTETTEGVKTYKCTVCGYVTRTETIAVLDHTHVPADDYSKDETGHWHTCSGCTEKLDLAAHTYGKWKITIPSTAQANGKKERSCTVCGYVQEGVVTYGGDESTGDMDNTTKPDNNACHADLELTDEEIINKIPLTPEGLEAIENGADLEVYMVVIDYSGNVPSADKDLSEAVLTDGMKIGMYIDVTLFVKVGDNDPRAVTNTNGEMKITFEMPEMLINTDTSVTRKYSIIRVHNGEAAILDCAYDKTTAKGSFVTDKFSTYSIAYKDITEEEPAPEPAPVVRYPIVINGNVTVDKTAAAAGETVNVRTDFGYDIIVTAANGQRIAQITEKGSFTMPACKVSVTAVQNETFTLMATAWRQSYVYSYDSDMNKIKVNSTRKQGIITVNLGKEYAGKSFTIYEGKKSTKVKVTDGVLDAKGRFTFEVPDGKNYTLIVED